MNNASKAANPFVLHLLWYSSVCGVVYLLSGFANQGICDKWQWLCVRVSRSNTISIILPDAVAAYEANPLPTAEV